MEYLVTTTRNYNEEKIQSVFSDFSDVIELVENLCSDNESIDTAESFKALESDTQSEIYGEKQEEITDFFLENHNGFIVYNGEQYDECTPTDGGTIWLVDYTIEVKCRKEVA